MKKSEKAKIVSGSITPRMREAAEQMARDQNYVSLSDLKRTMT